MVCQFAFFFKDKKTTPTMKGQHMFAMKMLPVER
jgi:hypothetical protein